MFRQHSNDGVHTTAELLARAIDWLLEEDVEVINMSLAGPGELLEQLTAHAADLGDPGRDPTFGWGLVQAPPDCRSLAARD